MSTPRDREQSRQITLNRIEGRVERTILGQSVLAARAIRLRECPPWREQEQDRLVTKLVRTAIRCRETRHDLALDLAILGTQGGLGWRKQSASRCAATSWPPGTRSGWG